MTSLGALEPGTTLSPMSWVVSAAELEVWSKGHPGVSADTDDVRLTIACARGDAAALEAFDARFRGPIAQAVRSMGDDDFVHEVTQLVRQRLLWGDGTAPPRIAEFGGRGSLGKFVQAVAVRTALNLREARKRHLGIDESDDVLLELPAGVGDPELEPLKLRYRAEFKLAFAAALEGLEPALRAAVRQVYGDGLTLAEVGKLYGWSVPTASRRLADARAQLLTGTRAHLAQQLQLSTADVDSVLRLIESRLSVDGLGPQHTGGT